jgi:hypothetical protein
MLQVGQGVCQEFWIRWNPSELESTAYLEVGPGRYGGRHWQDGYLFIGDDAFRMAEGLLRRHFPGYDRFAINEIPRAVGAKVIADWRTAAGRLSDATPEVACEALGLPAHEDVVAEVAARGEEISAMLYALADACEGFYRREEWSSVLGI